MFQDIPVHFEKDACKAGRTRCSIILSFIKSVDISSVEICFSVRCYSASEKLYFTGPEGTNDFIIVRVCSFLLIHVFIEWDNFLHYSVLSKLVLIKIFIWVFSLLSCSRLLLGDQHQLLVGVLASKLTLKNFLRWFHFSLH